MQTEPALGPQVIPRTSFDNFQAIVDATPECVKLVAADGTLVHINSAGVAMLGVTSAEAVVGHNVYDLVAPEHRAAFREFNEQVCSGQKGSLEFDMIDAAGRRRQMESHASPVAHLGRIVQLAITRDVTEKKRIERDALLLSAIIDSSDDAIISKNLDGVVTSWNQSAERVFGYTAEEAIGKTIAELLIPWDRQDEEPDILSRLRRGERVDHFETVRRRKDGTLLDISLTISPVRDAQGTVIGASKIARDITERKRSQRAALLLSAIVDSSDDAIISKDLNGVITSWNKSAERVFGYTAEEAIGQPVAKLLIPADRQNEEPDILARLRRGERVDHFETIRRRKDGTLLDISLTISPVKDAQNRVIGASKIARDISGQKRAERAIAESNEQMRLDLVAMTRMQRLSTQLLHATEFSDLLGEILSAGMEITGADMGVVQLIEDGMLKLVTHRGFDQRSMHFFSTVQTGDAACGNALALGRRVIVEDVSSSPMYSPEAREAVLAAGVRAVQSTPLISRSGQILGMFSTHFRAPHQTTEREIRLLDILVRQAADLIERKRAETALVASEARFRRLADSMPQIVWTAGADGEVDYFNERWYEFTGFRPDESADNAWHRILHPEDVEPARTRWSESIGSGTPFEMELRFWDMHQNRWRWFIGRAVPVRDERGNISKWFGSSTDIDEQKRIEAELRHANQDLEQFAFSASHDLQEPLRTVKIYSELLFKRYSDRLDGQALDFLSYLRTGATRMEMLVRDLLAYTRVTTLAEISEATDANEVLRATLDSLAGAVSEAGAKISADPLPELHVHASHLQQLFQNIIGNAVKYRSPDRQPVIHVSAERNGDYWTFAIADNGIGIDPQYTEGIFGLFRRLHTGDRYSGTGIGLAICQRIVDRYRGRIWVESEPGQGSTFRFTLPV